MGGPSFEPSFSTRGHGPSSFGGAGSQFDDFQYDFSKLDIDDKKGMEGGLRRAKSTRRVSFNTSRGPPRHYEYYCFTKGDDWSVADRMKISAPQEELEKTVTKAKKNSSVLEAMKKMSADRRAQISRLVEQKNLEEESRDDYWHCVYIDSPSPRVKDIGGKRVMEYKKMNVIVAQCKFPGPAKSSSNDRSRSFVGERSDIHEPLRPKDKVKNKDKHPKDGKENKENKESKESKESKENGKSKDSRSDPFDSEKLFNDRGVPLDRRVPIPEYPPPQQLPFDPGMGQPFGPPRDQHMASFPPRGPADNQMFGNLGSQPVQGQKLPNDIEIVGDPIPPQSGADRVFDIRDLLSSGPGNAHPHYDHQQPHFQQAPINVFNDAGAPPTRRATQPFVTQDPPNARYRKQSEQPFIIQAPPPKSRRHYTKEWMNDNSSYESDDEFPFFEEDELSSRTSYGDEHEKFVLRGSLVPHRRSSTKRLEPTYREHRRGSSYPIQPSHHPEPRRDTRYQGERVDTIIERPHRRHSSRERREAVRYVHQQQQPPPPPPVRRLEYQARSPPLTPLSNSSYSPSRRFSGLPYPSEVVEREHENERLAENYMLDRQEGRTRREKERDREAEDREFMEKNAVRDRWGARTAGHDRYWSPR